VNRPRIYHSATLIRETFDNKECLYPYKRLMETTVNILDYVVKCNHCGSIDIYKNMCLVCGEMFTNKIKEGDK